MAHNLATNADGSATMFYTGQAPWHGLGTHLDNPATSAEAMSAAGLDFQIVMEDLATTSGLNVPMGQAAVRSDTRDVLGMVGRKWKPVQNSEAFAFLDGLVGDDGLRYHTAGALGRGQRVWMLAKLPNDIRVTGTDDVTEKFLLLSNAHDGFSSLRVFFTPVRVVCQNTLNAAEKTAQRQGVTIRHTGNLDAKMNEARRVLGLAERFYGRFQEQADAMAAMKLDRRSVLAYFQTVFRAPEDAEKQKRAADNAKETWDSLMNLYEHGKGNDMPGVKHSLWAAYNAVTEYVDHDKPNARAEKLAISEARENRLNSIWFGTGAAVKGSAFEAAMAMVSGRN